MKKVLSLVLTLVMVVSALVLMTVSASADTVSLESTVRARWTFDKDSLPESPVASLSKFYEKIPNAAGTSAANNEGTYNAITDGVYKVSGANYYSFMVQNADTKKILNWKQYDFTVFAKFKVDGKVVANETQAIFSDRSRALALIMNNGATRENFAVTLYAAKVYDAKTSSADMVKVPLTDLPQPTADGWYYAAMSVGTYANGKLPVTVYMSNDGVNYKTYSLEVERDETNENKFYSNTYFNFGKAVHTAKSNNGMDFYFDEITFFGVAATVDQVKAYAQEPVVYISDNGVDTNDGLTAATPVRTPAKALQILNANFADKKYYEMRIVDKYTHKALPNLYWFTDAFDKTLKISAAGEKAIFNNERSSVAFKTATTFANNVILTGKNIDNTSRLTNKSFTFYVDGVNGNNANDGWTPATAKKTIQGAVPQINTKGVTVNIIIIGQYNTGDNGAAWNFPVANSGVYAPDGSTVVISGYDENAVFNNNRNGHNSNADTSGGIALTADVTLKDIKVINNSTIGLVSAGKTYNLKHENTTGDVHLALVGGKTVRSNSCLTYRSGSYTCACGEKFEIARNAATEKTAITPDKFLMRYDFEEGTVNDGKVDAIITFYANKKQNDVAEYGKYLADGVYTVASTQNYSLWIQIKEFAKFNLNGQNFTAFAKFQIDGTVAANKAGAIFGSNSRYLSLMLVTGSAQTDLKLQLWYKDKTKGADTAITLTDYKQGVEGQWYYAAMVVGTYNKETGKLPVSIFLSPDGLDYKEIKQELDIDFDTYAKSMYWNFGKCIQTANGKTGWSVKFDEIAIIEGAVNSTNLRYYTMHNFEVNQAVEATCTTAGCKAGMVCADCGLTVADPEVIAAKGHTVVTEETVQPTCLFDGKIGKVYCSDCDTVFVAEEVLNKLGHVEVVDAAVAATCTAAGKTEGKHCAVCEKVIVPQTEVAKLAHTYGEAIVVDMPTAKEEGKSVKNCATCGDVVEEVVPVLESGCGASVAFSAVIISLVTALGTCLIRKKH